MTKEELIKLIERLEKNPDDRVGIFADIGVTALGAIGGGAVAAAFGTSIASIPIFTAITGIGMVVAAPFVLVAGAAVAGGAVVYGVSRLIKDGGFHEGKRSQLLNELRENLKEVKAKERQSNLDERDKTKLYSFLKEPLRYDLITPEEAQQLMEAVETGQIPLSEAYKLIENILSSVQISQPEKVITNCPKCSQKLRVPSDLGNLNLTCPKCRHSWLFSP